MTDRPTSADATRRDEETVRLGGPSSDPLSTDDRPPEIDHQPLIAAEGFRGWKILRQFPTRGGEADLFLVERSGETAVLKLYHFGLSPRLEVLERLSEVAGRYPRVFTAIRERGVDAVSGRFFEFQEFVPGGTVRDILDAGSLPEAAVQRLVEQARTALSALHQVQILHLDLKPANLLVRTSEPLTIALTDFGIATLLDPEVSKKFTQVKGTSLYQSPESLSGTFSAASDWWSLGMMVLEALAGKHPFADLHPQVIFYHLSTRNIVVPASVSGRWGTLVKGLLTRDPTRRWGEIEVGGWLNGEDLPHAFDDPGMGRLFERAATGQLGSGEESVIEGLLHGWIGGEGGMGGSSGEPGPAGGQRFRELAASLAGTPLAQLPVIEKSRLILAAGGGAFGRIDPWEAARRRIVGDAETTSLFDLASRPGFYEWAFRHKIVDDRNGPLWDWLALSSSLGWNSVTGGRLDCLEPHRDEILAALTLLEDFGGHLAALVACPVCPDVTLEWYLRSRNEFPWLDDLQRLRYRISRDVDLVSFCRQELLLRRFLADSPVYRATRILPPFLVEATERFRIDSPCEEIRDFLLQHRLDLCEGALADPLRFPPIERSLKTWQELGNRFLNWGIKLPSRVDDTLLSKIGPAMREIPPLLRRIEAGSLRTRALTDYSPADLWAPLGVVIGCCCLPLGLAVLPAILWFLRNCLADHRERGLETARLRERFEILRRELEGSA